MPQEAPFTLWKITCRSSDEAKGLAGWLASHIDLDRTIVDTVRTYPNGVEQVQAVPHRLGDYFAAIRVVPCRDIDPHCLRLGFERRTDADRYWKDLMVDILQEIEASPQKPSVALDSKSEPDEVIAGD